MAAFAPALPCVLLLSVCSDPGILLHIGNNTDQPITPPGTAHSRCSLLDRPDNVSQQGKQSLEKEVGSKGMDYSIGFLILSDPPADKKSSP